MPDDSLAALGENIRDQFTHQMNALSTGWLDDGFSPTEWEPLRALETDYLNLLQPVMEWITLERWLTSRFIPETLAGETSTSEDSPTSWDTIFERLPGAEISSSSISTTQDATNIQYSIADNQSTDPPTTDYQAPHSAPFDYTPTESLSPTVPTRVAERQLDGQGAENDQYLISDYQSTDPPIPKNLQPPASFDYVSTESLPRTSPARSTQDADHSPTLSSSIQPASYFETSSSELPESTTPSAPPSPSLSNQNFSLTDQSITDNQSLIPDQPISNLQSPISSPHLRRPLLSLAQPLAFPKSNLPFTSTFDQLLPNSQIPIPNSEPPITHYELPVSNPPKVPPTSNTQYPVSNTLLRGLQDFAHAVTTTGNEDWSDEWEDDEWDGLSAPESGQESDQDRPSASTRNGKPAHDQTLRGVELPTQERQLFRPSLPKEDIETQQKTPSRSESATSHQDDLETPIPPIDMDEIYEALIEEVKREYRRFYGV